MTLVLSLYGLRIKMYEDKGNNKRRVRFGVSQFFYSLECLHSFYIAFNSFVFGSIYLVLTYQRGLLHHFKVSIACCQFLNFGVGFGMFSTILRSNNFQKNAPKYVFYQYLFLS